MAKTGLILGVLGLSMVYMANWI